MEMEKALQVKELVDKINKRDELIQKVQDADFGFDGYPQTTQKAKDLFIARFEAEKKKYEDKLAELE